ncbi:hypothetical protein BGZ68_001010 [Mortierella alpina]|nr:hypothetical protein BGZ68_001010 [Mortierella alpina]
MDPCKCKDSHKACGSSFPESCGLEKTTLYTCSGVNAVPSAPINCTLGCDLAAPDNHCIVDRSTDVNAIKSVIDTITRTMNNNLRANNLTLVAFPPLVNLLNEVETNLTHTTDPKDLQPVVEAVNSAVNSLTHVFSDVKPPLDAISPTTQPLSLISNGTLSNLVQSICQCPRTNGSDCVGALKLYRDYVASAQARTKLLGVGAMLAPLTRVSQDLTTSTKGYDVALPVGNIAALNESATLLNKIIGYTSGNVQQYGNISDSVMLVYDSAKEVVVCKGLGASQFIDKCSTYTARLNGVLSDFIQFIETNIGFIPVVGPLIVNPLLDALRHLLIDVQNGVATALGGIVSLLNALVQVLNVVSPPSSTNIVRDYLLRLVGIMDVPAECGGLKDRCSGLFKIVHMITDGFLNLIGQIPLAGFLIRPALEPVLNGLLDALQKGVASAIKVALGLLDGVVNLVGLIPGVGNVLKVLIDTVKALVDCLVVPVSSQLGAITGSNKFQATYDKSPNLAISRFDGTVAVTHASDYDGAMDLYRSFVTSAQARTKLLGVGAMVAPLIRVSQDLAASTKEFDVALPAGNIAALNESATLLNQIIGYTSGDVQKYGDISDSVSSVYDSAKEVVVSKGLDVTKFLDKCSTQTDRLNGALSDFIQFIEKNIGFIPVVGPLIVNPLLDALRNLLIDVQKGVATALGGVVSLLNALVHVLDLVSPPSSTNAVRDYLLRLMGIMDVPAECGGLMDRCSGLFKIVHMITDGLLNLIGRIPVASFLIRPALEPVLNGLLEALQKGTVFTVTTALGMLDGVAKLVGFIPGVGNVVKVLRDTVKALVDCMVVRVDPVAMNTGSGLGVIENSVREVAG